MLPAKPKATKPKTTKPKAKKALPHCHECDSRADLQIIDKIPYCKKHYDKCRSCRKLFGITSRFLRHGYCPDDLCQRKYRKLLSARAQVTRKERAVEANCVYCQKPFLSTSPNHKYCSSACQRITVYERGRYIIFERDGFKCIYCGRSSFGDGEELHADHIHPQSKGGEDTAENTATACSRCNVEKLDRLLRNEKEILAEIKNRNEQAGIRPKTKIKL